MSVNRSTADLLNDHLDARSPGTGQLLSEHDPDMAALVDAFYTSDDTPGPPPELASQIWLDLTIVAKNDKRRRPRLSTNVVSFEPNAERDSEGTRQRTGSQRGRWALSLLATAALVLLALAGSLLVLQGTRPALDQPTESLYLPANSSAITPVLVMAATAETWPKANPLLWASLQRITIDRGETEAAVRAVGDAAVLFTIEAGHLTVDASGPVTVTRGSDDRRDAPVTETADTPIQLKVGDTLFTPAGVTMSRSNVGSEPVVMLELRIAELEQTHRPENVHYLRLISDKVLNIPPVTPAELAVQRLELLPGESLAIGELPGLQMLVVESGSLELLGGYQLGNQSATGSDTVTAGNGQSHFDTTTGLANRGAEPTVFLAVTITPAQ
jgi:hypothetical protein